jgi:formaldehyde-activating enzyme involved in methanogenesis
MHLYQHGMDLSLVSQWLGHSNIETTRIYAYADTETTREAIVRAMQGSPESSGTAEKYTVTDESLLRLLYGL